MTQAGAQFQFARDAVGIEQFMHFVSFLSFYSGPHDARHL